MLSDAEVDGVPLRAWAGWVPDLRRMAIAGTIRCPGEAMIWHDMGIFAFGFTVGSAVQVWVYLWMRRPSREPGKEP